MRPTVKERKHGEGLQQERLGGLLHLRIEPLYHLSSHHRNGQVEKDVMAEPCNPVGKFTLAMLLLEVLSLGGPLSDQLRHCNHVEDEPAEGNCADRLAVKAHSDPGSLRHRDNHFVPIKVLRGHKVTLLRVFKRDRQRSGPKFEFELVVAECLFQDSLDDELWEQLSGIGVRSVEEGVDLVLVPFLIHFIELVGSNIVGLLKHRVHREVITSISEAIKLLITLSVNKSWLESLLVHGHLLYPLLGVMATDLGLGVDEDGLLEVHHVWGRQPALRVALFKVTSAVP